MNRMSLFSKLAVVPALAGAVDWLLQRISGLSGAASSLIRSFGGGCFGQRERFILVEVAGTWVVLGVTAAAGQARPLHGKPETEIPGMPAAHAL